MTLYSYDHCPFCMRVRMIFAFHHLPYEHKILANDDEATPIGLIGQKMLPILIKPDGTAMGESLDIIDFVDAYAHQNHHTQPLDREVRQTVSDWLSHISSYYNHLTMPRLVQIGLEEFLTQAAIDYFVHKKTKLIGDFAENIADSEQYINKINNDLIALEQWTNSANSLKAYPSLEDILVFPLLRSLSVVKGIDWPEKVKQYVLHMAGAIDMPLFFERAI